MTVNYNAYAAASKDFFALADRVRDIGKGLEGAHTAFVLSREAATKLREAAHFLNDLMPRPETFHGQD